MTGNSEHTHLIGEDQFHLCFCKFLFPEADADQCTVFICDQTGRVCSRQATSDHLKEMHCSCKRGSTEASQAFLPINILKHHLFWTAPPLLSIAGVQRHKLKDGDEAGFEVSDCNSRHGHSAVGIHVRKAGNCVRDTKMMSLLFIKPGHPQLPPNVCGSVQNPR